MTRRSNGGDCRFNLHIQFTEKVLGERRLLAGLTVEECSMMVGAIVVILRAGQEVFGMSPGRIPPGERP